MVLAYVNSVLAKGFPPDQIANALIQNGYDKRVIDPHLPIVSLSGISKSFRDNSVLKDLTLHVNEGELLGIIGLSGSGKTTLLNVLLGLHEPDSGSLHIKHSGLQYRSSPSKDIVGYAPQDPSFYRRLTVWENLDHFASLFKVRDKSQVPGLIRFFGLEKATNTLAGNLSGGMQRRLGIACALVHDPQLLVLDEPTADLDPFLRKEIWDMINHIKKKKTVLLTTHFLSEVDDICDRIGILHKGSLKALGSPDFLKRNYSRNMEIILELRSSNYKPIIDELQKKEHISNVVHRDHKIVIYTPEGEKTLSSLINIIKFYKEKIHDIELNRPGLTEVFESFVK
ncbi:MAG: ABC transporter ATP-binding protein [Candidatus Woesearchaeota archaeon]